MPDSLQPHGPRQAPLSMESSRQEYWSGLPFRFPNAGLSLKKKKKRDFFKIEGIHTGLEGHLNMSSLMINIFSELLPMWLYVEIHGTLGNQNTFATNYRDN